MFIEIGFSMRIEIMLGFFNPDKMMRLEKSKSWVIMTAFFWIDNLIISSSVVFAGKNSVTR